MWLMPAVCFFNGSLSSLQLKNYLKETVIYYSTESKISKKDKGPIGS